MNSKENDIGNLQNETRGFLRLLFGVVAIFASLSWRKTGLSTAGQGIEISLQGCVFQ